MIQAKMSSNMQENTPDNFPDASIYNPPVILAEYSPTSIEQKPSQSSDYLNFSCIKIFTFALTPESLTPSNNTNMFRIITRKTHVATILHGNKNTNNGK